MLWHSRYDPGVPPEIQLPDGPLTRLLAESARRFPRRCALWSEQGSLSYEQLVGEVQRFAAVLAQLGVRAGDRVLVMLPNSLHQVIAVFGALWRGAVAVPSWLDMPGEVLARQLEESRPRLAVLPTPLPSALEKPLRESGPEHLVFVSGREYTRSLRGWLRRAVAASLGGQRILRWRQLMEHASVGFPLEPLDSSAPALLIYTGGTTGSPRGVLLSHRALVANTLQLAAWDSRHRAGAERILLALPLAHSYGFTAGLSLGLATGATVILAERPAVLELIGRFKPSLFPGVPALYAALLNRPDLRSYKLSSIRACLSGAAPLPVEVQQGFEKVTKGRLVEGYGLTEASPATHANPLYGERRSGSVGLPLPSTEAKVVDLATLEELPPGKVGELWVRGPQLMDGYWQEADVFVEGWLRTGDLAQMDPDGYFFLIDRVHDVLEIDGRPVYPRDVEEVLYEHPSVAEAAVAAWPPGGERTSLGRQRAEGLRAFVVRRPGQKVSFEELERFCRRRLSPPMVPGEWSMVRALPRTPLGKLMRRRLETLVEEV